jgi:hypothetical protein
MYMFRNIFYVFHKHGMLAYNTKPFENMYVRDAEFREQNTEHRDQRVPLQTVKIHVIL